MLFTVFALSAIAQGISIDDVSEQKSEKHNKNYIYTATETIPKFKSGENGFGKYVVKNFKLAKPNEPLKKIILTFVVEINGKLSEAKIIRGSGNAEADAEVLRLTTEPPKWIPGTIGGKPVRVQYSVPLTIEMEQ